MLSAVLAGLLTFGAVAACLRAAEWLYHRWRRTPDWSPHWGTWVFAALTGAYTFLDYVGR